VDLLVQAGLVVLVPPTQQVGLKDEVIKEMPSILGDKGDNDEKKVLELKAFSAELLTLHPLAALGLDPDEHDGQITVETVRAAFRQMAARYHPDRIGSADQRVREAAADVFSVINEIHEQLEDPEVLARALREIRRKRQKGVATSELDVERARVMARLAEARMRKSNWKAARDLWVQAREMKPDPFFEMQETFCRAVLKEIPYDMAAKTLAEIKFDKEEDQDRKIAGERVRREAERRFRVGWLHKLSGSEALAQPWFERTLEILPEHTEALRELRLKRMRKEKAKSESKSGRGFGGLFKWGKKKGGKS
jgi:curved DNA-binding protein CbpA